ncbi:MAG TPA: polysaccharide biosynthesis/export family protein [Novosphingobium sp.]|nr:polysaccharide biosynthesis/export family protein [Novosphingobium sp.]HZV10031.1 polysaccharide biosynthesis/export family protein [Novosphingobium sp.]
MRLMFKACGRGGLALALAGAAMASGACGVAQAGEPAQPAALAGYVLGADDKVHINVFGEEKLTGDYTVTSEGIISFPLIGSVPAAGRSLGDVQEEIRRRLADGYLLDPRVAIEVGTFRSLYILGEVNKPGEYPYRTNVTLEQVVATAGGYTYRANRRQVLLRHLGEEKDEKLKLGEAMALHLQPGDTVRVPERFF